MTLGYAKTTRSLMFMAFVAAAVIAGGCSTDSGTRKPGSLDPVKDKEKLSATQLSDDPYRIICRRAA